MSIPFGVFKAWYDQIQKDLTAGIIIDVHKGFEKLLTERSYGGLDYAVFLEGAKKDISSEAAEQLCMLLSQTDDRFCINQKTKNILKQFGGMRYISEMTNSEVLRFRKEFLKAYQEGGDQ